MTGIISNHRLRWLSGFFAAVWICENKPSWLMKKPQHPQQCCTIRKGASPLPFGNISNINFFNIISIILINTKFPRNISAISKPNVSYIINTWKARECILFLEGSLLEWKRPGGGGLAAQQACYDTETSISWSFYFHICGKILKDFPFPQCKRFGLDIFCKFPRSRRMGFEIYCLERECSILVSAKGYYHVHFLEVT